MKKSSDCSVEDRCRAFTALAEGDATLAMYLYAHSYIPAVDMMQSRSRAAGVESRVLDSSPAFVRGLQMFPYQEGLAFVATLYDSGGWAKVGKVYQDPPQSTEQILHPDRYGKDKPQEVTLPDLASNLKGNWRMAESNAMGELELRLVLAQYVGSAAAELAAKGWGGDHYALWQQGEKGPYLLVMRTVWDDQSEADEFWTLYPVLMEHRSAYTEQVQDLVGTVSSHWWSSKEGWVFASQQDRSVTIVIGPDKETVEQVVEALSK